MVCKGQVTLFVELKELSTPYSYRHSCSPYPLRLLSGNFRQRQEGTVREDLKSQVPFRPYISPILDTTDKLRE